MGSNTFVNTVLIEIEQNFLLFLDRANTCYYVDFMIYQILRPDKNFLKNLLVLIRYIWENTDL